jgi:hypothetical protein
MNPSGQADGESRLDRLERLFEQYTERNERAHEEFEAEHKRLLIAQVLMVDTMSKLELKLDELADKLDGLIGVVESILKKGLQ